MDMFIVMGNYNTAKLGNDSKANDNCNSVMGCKLDIQ